MGASPEVGRYESCIRRFALPAVVQSIHRPASEAPVAVDPRSPRRIRVLCLSGGQTNIVHRHVTVWIKISWLPCVATAKVDLSSHEAVPDVCRKEEEMGWRSVTQVHHKLREKIVFKLWDAGVDPGTFGLHNILNNWNIVSNMTFFTFFCKACRKWLTWVFYSLWDRPRCTLSSINAPSEPNVSSLFSLLCTWDSRWVLVLFFESISATYLLSSMERYKRI